MNWFKGINRILLAFTKFYKNIFKRAKVLKIRIKR
jgi:hypothetical protein